MNAIFVCVFNQSAYVDLFLLLLESILLYGNIKEDTNIIVYTSTAFMEKIKQSSLYEDTILFEINDAYNTIDQSCKARLDVFELSSIQNYETILYLDTDILVKEDISSLFSICKEEKLYVLEEGKLSDSDHYYGGITLFGDKLRLFPNATAFTSGMILFRRCETIKNLFERIRKDILARPHTFECCDQPYIVYDAFISNLYNNTEMKKYAVNNNSSIHSRFAIHHFPGGPGIYENKWIKMTQFLNTLNASRFTTGVRLINRKTPAKPSVLLVGACVSYQYMDSLRYTLPINIPHFQKLYIVTQEDDKETIEFCKQFKSVELVYYTFKNENKLFDKFGAMNKAQAIMYEEYPDAWYLNIDSDILLPNNLSESFIHEKLDPECIYGGLRNNVTKTSELFNKPKIILSKENASLEWNDCIRMNYTVPFILGCFQLYKKKVYHRSTLDNSSGMGDVCFCKDHFDKMCILKNIVYFHLGVGKVNWSGKVVSFIEDIPISFKDLYYTSHKECTNTYYNTQRQIIKYGEGINIENDVWTCSDKMRIEIGNFFNRKEYKIAEIGSHKGYTTRVLSNIFSKVYSVDNSIEWSRMNQLYNRDMRNIEYVFLDIYKDDWNILPEDIDVVFIDAKHDYESCKSDLTNAVKRFKSLKYIIFDDYGVWKGVRKLVDEYISSKWLKFESFLGLENVPGPVGIVHGVHEGILCSLQNQLQTKRFSLYTSRNNPQMRLFTNYR